MTTTITEDIAFALARVQAASEVPSPRNWRGFSAARARVLDAIHYASTTGMPEDLRAAAAREAAQGSVSLVKWAGASSDLVRYFESELASGQVEGVTDDDRD